MVCRQNLVITLGMLLIGVSVNAAEMTLRYFNNDKYENVKIAEVQKARFSANCIKQGKPQCSAWTVFVGQPKPQSESKVPLAGNPAARYCWDVGAKNRILKTTDNKQYDYCVFADGSMVDSWDLYYKHFPKEPPIK